MSTTNRHKTLSTPPAGPAALLGGSAATGGAGASTHPMKAGLERRRALREAIEPRVAAGESDADILADLAHGNGDGDEARLMLAVCREAREADTARAAGLRVVNAADWLAVEPDPADDIMQGLFEAGDKVCLIAGSKQRKTFWLTQAALCLATGRPFLAWPVARPVRVLMVQLEVKALHFHRRLWRMARACGIARADVADRLAIVNGRGVRATPENIMAAAESHLADVIVLDPLFKLLTGDENLARDMKPLLADFDRLAEATGAAIVYSHHDPKGVAGDRETRDRGAGSNVLSRDYDACVTLTEHASEPDSAVVAVLSRNHPPSEPFTITWRDGAFYTSDAVPDAKTSRTRKPVHGDKILALREAEPDLTRREVARRVGCSLSTVQDWWDR